MIAHIGEPSDQLEEGHDQAPDDCAENHASDGGNPSHAGSVEPRHATEDR
jgi:hypothetical protein